MTIASLLADTATTTLAAVDGAPDAERAIMKIAPASAADTIQERSEKIHATVDINDLKPRACPRKNRHTKGTYNRGY
jgi:hypothetical protein